MTNLSVSLQVGQRVKLQDTEKGYELTLLAEGETGDTIVDVGLDYLEVEAAGAEVKVRIPFFLIRTVATKPAEPLAA